MESYVSNIIRLIDNLNVQLKEFLSTIIIDYTHYDDEMLVAFPNYHYSLNLSDDRKKKQLILIKKHKELKQHFEFICKSFTNNDITECNNNLQRIEKHINLDGDYDVKNSITDTLVVVEGYFCELRNILSPFIHENPIEVYIIDTNSLLKCYKLDEYVHVTSNKKADILLLPTVLEELDTLKVRHPDQDFRNKVKKIINYIKGLRKQGDLLEGVTVNKILTIKALANEPDFRNTFNWLDKENKDDRIIASILEVQKDDFSKRVILITDDINMQNKASFANIPYTEPPKQI